MSGARPQPVGLAEIARRLGVKVDTANHWRSRGLLPEPGPGTVSGAPWWDWADIEEWAERTKRLRMKLTVSRGAQPGHTIVTNRGLDIMNERLQPEREARKPR